ncbi:hypothetical protein F2Q70_00035611 [Brassica cretica]|uniref:Uncharacterized protein n=1 Tax=Brassica cretica TaxID=69181 RepID=A0A8S9JTE3_BRACR|nr:hypothetical protein F2Q70_00035611 [Brassica cretica]KAF3528710.1 hypothetical protein DY000_02039462 [Brassica cretica]
MSLFDYSVIASFALPNEYSRIGVHDSTLFDQATFLESSSPSPTNPANLVHPLVSLVSRMHLGLELSQVIRVYTFFVPFLMNIRVKSRKRRPFPTALSYDSRVTQQLLPANSF